MFITLYGINNIGKTTHCKRLVERLIELGHDAVGVKFPVYDIEPSGRFLNQVLRSGKEQGVSEEELQLWFALNRFQFEPTLREWLAAGKIVVAEDYTGTGIAWGMTKGASLEWLETVNAPLLTEDLAILLEGQRTVAATEKGHLHEENHALVDRCRASHRLLAERYGWKTVEVQPHKADTFALIEGVVLSALS